MAAALACQAVARLRPRAPPSRSAPSHRSVRDRAEAAARRGARAPGARGRQRRQLRAESPGSGGGVPGPGGANTCRGPPVAPGECAALPRHRVPACWGRDHRCRQPSLPRNTCCCSLSARGGDTATDVLAGEEAAPPPGRSRPSAPCPVDEGSERWVRRPELRAAATGQASDPARAPGNAGPAHRPRVCAACGLPPGFQGGSRPS